MFAGIRLLGKSRLVTVQMLELLAYVGCSVQGPVLLV